MHTGKKNGKTAGKQTKASADRLKKPKSSKILSSSNSKKRTAQRAASTKRATAVKKALGGGKATVAKKAASLSSRSTSPKSAAKKSTAKKKPVILSPQTGLKKGTAKKAALKKTPVVKKSAAKSSAHKTVAAKKPSPGGVRKAAIKKQATTGGAQVARPVIHFEKIWDVIRERLPADRRIAVRRPDDFLVFDLILHNLSLVTAGTKPILVRKGPNAYIVAELPPQSFGEEAFLEGQTDVNKDKEFPEVSENPDYPDKNVPADDSEPLDPLPSAKIRMAGRSRIAFTMPADKDEIPYTLAAVLDAFRTWPLRLDVNALPERTLSFAGSDEIVQKPDHSWLKDVVKSSSWSAAKDLLADALARSGVAKAQKLIDTAARRLADKTAQLLAKKQIDGIVDTLQRDMTSSIDTIVRQVPGLRASGLRDTALCALTFELLGRLAGSRLKFPFAPEVWKVFVPHEPAPDVTALEMPYRLHLSPIGSARWQHRDGAFTANSRTELWHTRLSTTKSGIGPDASSKVRAIWSPDCAEDEADIFQYLDPVCPYRMSLDPLDRRMLVRLMAGFNENRFTPKASVARRLILTALGGFLDSEGNWTERPGDIGLEQWRHLTTLGRDHYVRVVYAGFLCPFGHAASLIKVTERKFEYLDTTNKKNRVAVLRQRFFIVVRERVKSFDGSVHKDFAGRNFPFQSVEILTRVTPNLQPPEACKLQKAATASSDKAFYTDVPPRAAFWPMIQGGDFSFQLAATDLGGNRMTFAMPLLFVGAEVNFAKPDGLIEAYNRKGYQSKTEMRRTTLMGNASICYAPVKTGTKGDPRLPTSSMTFNAGHVTYTDHLRPLFYPQVEKARVGIRSVQKLLGRDDAVVEVRYPDVYKTQGFGGDNSGELFLEALSDYDLKFGEDASQAKSDGLGALCTPGMAISGLSRTMGPAADRDKVTANTFDPVSFFKDARILGGISLADLLDIVVGLDGGKVPKMVSEELHNRLEARFTWDTEIKKSDPLELFIPKADGQKPTPFVVKCITTVPVGNPQALTREAHASLRNFKVNLFGFIILWFDRLEFSASAGSKPDVSAVMHEKDAVTFGGPLEFVNDLKDYIPIEGFSDPPSLSVTPSGITASYSLNLPSIQVGIFALSNLSLGAGFSLPFDSNPALVKFNFCQRESPFNLTVSFLGGGGFFALGLGTEGIREIEAALEFGAGVSIDLGVASGGVEIKAGVYFHWLQVSDTKTVELTGYVRIHGELSIIGIISVSLTFNLSLSYLKENGASTVWGEAELIVEIEILCFSTSVSVICRREFSGGASDPTVQDLIPDPSTWTDYCSAFAEEVA